MNINNPSYVKDRAKDMLARGYMLDALHVTPEERMTITGIGNKNVNRITQQDVQDLTNIQKKYSWYDAVDKNTKYLMTINNKFGEDYIKTRQLDANDATTMRQIKERYEAFDYKNVYVNMEDRTFINRVRDIRPKKIKPKNIKKPTVKKVIINNYDLVDNNDVATSDNNIFLYDEQNIKKETKNENDISLLNNKHYRSKDNCG
ncbi:MAG: hypothetical protein IJT15_04005 [Rickettsiales bacterium]|nr:hypothetical protein [Rickettsiales bacterium]